MGYYNQLYDINFFLTDSYTVNVESVSVNIKKPGIIVWDTWHSKNMDAEEAKKLFLDLDQIKKINQPEAILLELVACEQAYRDGNDPLFLSLIEKLKASKYPDVLLKAEKMILAHNALQELLSVPEAIKQAIAYVSDNKQSLVTVDDVVVETPVRQDWEAGKYSHKNPEDVESFYKNTYSYILELTAANYQVETLFNYLVVIKFLKSYGVKNLLDYGGGIGTFCLLANTNGIKSTYAELDSHTKRFAEEQFKLHGTDIDSIVINESFIFPEDIDCIVSTEVLEHIFEPEMLVEKMYKSLPKSGLLVISESFDYIDEFCTHLPQHKGKGGKAFISYMNSVGFKNIPTQYLIHPKIFIKR